MDGEGDHGVTADSLHRYRLTRSSLQGNKLVCNTASDVALQQVLEEEREAWQVHSPRPVNRLYLPDSLEVSPPYENLQGQRDDASTWASTTLQSLVEKTNHSDSAVQQSTSLLASRRSFFKEGSMNEGSRGTASTWIKPTVLPNQRVIDTDTVGTVLESDGSTPRASLASQSSFSSSIDIKEFKPLPEPPTTIKATMKTLAGRMKRKLPPNQDPCDSTDGSSTRSRPSKKSLRKSLSTWKIFGNGESDAESIASSLQDDNKSTKSTHTMRTTRFRKKDKQPDPMDDPHISVLDERKRRAEVAYAYHFGTVRKRQKQQLDSAIHQLETVANHDTATVRRRDSAMTMTTNTLHIIDGSKLAALDNVAFNPASSEQHSAPSTVSARQRQHCRSNSQDSTSIVGSIADRRKRTSRSELEKENQQLRSMLIEEKQAQIHRIHSQVRRKTSGNDTNWQIYEDKSMNISEEPIEAPAPPPTTKSRSKRSLAHEIPPVPALPLSLANQNTLASRASDTSTVKRHRGGAQVHGIELPRSLSMVLEGSEDEASSGNGANMKHAKHRLTNTKGRLSPHAKCKNETSQVESLERAADPEKWEWPDDVF